MHTRSYMSALAFAGASLFVTSVRADPGDPVDFTVDDGVFEDSIGLTNGGQFIWMNRFTSAVYPVDIDEVQFAVSDQTVVGDTFEITFHADTDGDGNLATGAVFLDSRLVDVQEVGCETFNVVTIDPPVVFDGPGDIVIGIVNRDTVGVQFPACIDLTASATRSWVGFYQDGGGNVVNVPDEPSFPATTFGTVDSFGFAGNWLLRASGVEGEPGAGTSSTGGGTDGESSGGTDGESSGGTDGETGGTTDATSGDTTDTAGTDTGPDTGDTSAGGTDDSGGGDGPSGGDDSVSAESGNGDGASGGDDDGPDPDPDGDGGDDSGGGLTTGADGGALPDPSPGGCACSTGDGFDSRQVWLLLALVPLMRRRRG